MTAWAVSTAIAVSILILLVLVVRRPVARMFGARAAYALWLAPALRAVLPPLPQSLAVTPSVSGDAQYWLLTSAVAGGSEMSFEWLALLWLGGVVVMLGLHCWRHQHFISRALAAGRPYPSDNVRYDVVATPAVDGPAATGLIHPLILVPVDFEQRFSPDQQRFALWHEQLHHRRGDIWASAAALLVTSFLWFNPLAHLALRAFRRDMEAACDARLLADAGSAAAPAYAETILRCAARPVPRSLCALTTIDELKGRLTMLKLNHGAARRFAGLLVAGSLTLGGVALAAPAADEVTEETKKFTKKIEIRHVGGKDVVDRAGPGDLERIGANCPGEKFEIAADGGTSDKKQAIKFFLCTKKGESRAEIVKSLEKAAVELEKEGEMSGDVKAELLAKLRAKIAELKSGA